LPPRADDARRTGLVLAPAGPTNAEDAHLALVGAEHISQGVFHLENILAGQILSVSDSRYTLPIRIVSNGYHAPKRYRT
jgi:hypothetical protein